MMKTLYIGLLALIIFSCTSNAQEQKQQKKEHYKVVKTDAEWKAQLTPMEFYVLRKAGTERAFTGKYDKFYKDGVYNCKACSTPLFKSNHKFNSGTGWPSFDTAIKGNVGYDTDYDLGYARTEIHCNTCGGHLGHVFNDGPSDTTGKRYCVNSVSLQFESKNE